MNIGFAVLLLSIIFVSSKPQSQTCTLCKQVMTLLSSQIGNVVDEKKVTDYVQLACTTLLMTDWCTQELYPHMDDIFWALKSNQTVSTICQRVNLCQFKIISITGDILFAERDRLDRIIPKSDKQIQRIEIGIIDHSKTLPVMVIVGIACSPLHCAILLRGIDNTGATKYGITALSTYTQQHYSLPDGHWAGPWYDLHTDEFWIAYGTATNFTFGIFETLFGQFLPKAHFPLSNQKDGRILSGTILNRMLYFTTMNDTQVYTIDLAIRLFRGSMPAPMNTMLVSNEVTATLYGYAPTNDGVFKFNADKTRTTVVPINLSGVVPVPSSTIDIISNTMWLSLWGSANRAWMRIDLNKKTDNIAWTPVGSLEGYFDFNPYEIKSQEI